MEKADIVIIGAGIVGLALAYELSNQFPNRDILLIERNRRYGQETSSRNSEVIHAGLYYPKDTLKTRLCIEGNRLLYEFCQQYEVRHKRIGKIIVATRDEEIPLLKQLYHRGLDNGVVLKWVERDEVNRLEPAVHALAGVLSPNTGIVDSHHLMGCLYRLAVEQGVMMVFAHTVTRIEKAVNGYLVGTNGDEIKAGVVVNSAGLASDRVAAMAGINIDQHGYRLHYCKGEYYRLSSRININHLIYPPPGPTSLGIHITRDLAGGQKLGPNAYYIEEIDYDIDERYKHEFFEAAQKYLPCLTFNDLQLGYAGIRPKLQGPGNFFRDFIINEETEKGFSGFINLIGIESPGLTSCLAIARYVGNILHEMKL